MGEEIFHAGLSRNLAELDYARLSRLCLIKLHELDTGHTEFDFFRVAAAAFYNDMLVRSSKVFQQHQRNVMTFWKLKKQDEDAFEEARISCSANFDSMIGYSNKLKIIRDKTLVHIAEDRFMSPQSVWLDSDLTGNQLGGLINKGFEILKFVKGVDCGTYASDVYNGSDVREIMSAYIEKFPDCGIVMK